MKGQLGDPDRESLDEAGGSKRDLRDALTEIRGGVALERRHVEPHRFLLKGRC